MDETRASGDSLPSDLDRLRDRLVEAGFFTSNSRMNAPIPAVRLTRGDTSARFELDEDLGWLVALASSRWGGGWVEAEVVCRAEGRPYSPPAALASSVEAAVLHRFDRLPTDSEAAGRTLDALTPG